MRKIPWVMAAVLSLILWAAAGLPGAAMAQGGSVLLVHNDPGGALGHRVTQVRNLRRTGQRVEIRDGYCRSACTLYLGLPNLCVGRQARFGFHGPSNALPGIGLPPDLFDYWSRVMAEHYPAPLQAWFMRDGRMLTTGYYEITGADLIAMGLNECA